MSIKDTSRQDLRSLLLKNGLVVPTSLPSAIKHVDLASSRAAAIAARRDELGKNVIVTRKG